MKQRVYLGIDPGTTTSATGVAVFQGDVLVMADEFWTNPKDPLRLRIRTIYTMLDDYWGKIVQKCLRMPSVVCIEESVYRGKANNNLQRLLGVIENSLSSYMELIAVNPSTLKKYYGSGKYTKDEVYISLLSRLSPSQGNAILKKAIDNGEEDKGDAIACAYYGKEKYKEQVKKQTVGVSKTSK